MNFWKLSPSPVSYHHPIPSVFVHVRPASLMDHKWSSRCARAFPFHPAGRDPPSKLHRELNKLMKLASRVELGLRCRCEGGHHLNRIALPFISQALSCRYEGGHHLNRIASSRDCRRAFVCGCRRSETEERRSMGFEQ